MKHWTEYDSDGPVRTSLTVGVNPKLWHYIEQTRGKKSRAQFVRDILTKVMNTPKEKTIKAQCGSCGHVQVFGELCGLLPVCEKCGGHVFTVIIEGDGKK